MSGSQKSKVPTICGGIAGVVLVALLTGATVNTVLDKVNDNADKAYAEALADVQNAKIAEWQAEQERLAALEDTKVVLKPITITDYTVDDIIMIDGEMYVISAEPSSKPGIEGSSGTVENVDGTNSETTNPGSTDNESSDDTQTSVGVDGIDGVPYIGAEYVTIDIDGNMVYHVEKGDTLTKISNLTGYSVQELAEYNCIENVNLIYTGQSIRIPASQAAIDYVLGLQNASPNLTLEPVH